jgi:transcription initiation factor IIE alpha subunit
MDNNEKSTLVLETIERAMRHRYYPLNLEEIAKATNFNIEDTSNILRGLINDGTVIYVQGQAIEGYMLRKNL